MSFAITPYNKEARCWAGYEPVPGKKPYSKGSCRPKGTAKKKTKQAGDVDWKSVAAAGLLPPTIALAGHSILHPTLDYFWPHKSKADKYRSYALGGGMAAFGGTLRGIVDAMKNYKDQLNKQAGLFYRDLEQPIPVAVYDDWAGMSKMSQVASNMPAKKAAAIQFATQLLLTKQAEGGAWTRAEGKSESGGLNAKGRASLKAQGQNIKPPVTESNPTGERADRKSSFCARMGGMKKKLTSKETANDPDSRINKALRKWKC